MEKYKLLFGLSKLILIFGVILGGLIAMQTYGMFVFMDGSNGSVTTAYSSLSLMFPAFLMGACGIMPKMMDRAKKSGLLSGTGLHLLPMSLMWKYLFVLLLSLLICVTTILMSLPIELIGSILMASNSPEKQIVVGGMIRYFAENGIFPLILAEVSVAICVGTLFRNFLLGFSGLIVCSSINSFYFAFDKPMSLSLSECGVCLIIAVAFLVSGYQIFKRWQTANNGILMI